MVTSCFNHCWSLPKGINGERIIHFFRLEYGLLVFWELSVWLCGITSSKDIKCFSIWDQPCPWTVKRGAKQPRGAFKILTLIVSLPVHSHPMALITTRIKSKLLSSADKAYSIWPLPPFQIHFTPLSLSFTTVQPRGSSFCSSFPSLDLCTCSSHFLDTDCCWASLCRFQLKCCILRAPPWTSKLGELFSHCLSCYSV